MTFFDFDFARFFLLFLNTWRRREGVFFFGVL